MVAFQVPDELRSGGSGAAGFIAGLLTAGIAGAAEVTFERKIRCGPGVEARDDGAGGAWLGWGAVRAVIARPGAPRIAVPSMPSLAEAREAAARFDASRHPAPLCFVCGPDAAEDGGMGIVCGPLAGGGVAGTWSPRTSVCDLHGFVRREYAWAALTCPGAWAAVGLGRPAVLCRLTAEPLRPIVGGDEHIVHAWRTGQSGRSAGVGIAIGRADDEVCLRATATWATAAAEGRARAA